MAASPSIGLLIVDMQNDFMPTGTYRQATLSVADANLAIAPINKLRRHVQHVVLSMDYHPIGHVSFMSTHKRSGAENWLERFGPEACTYGSEFRFRDYNGERRVQRLWPDHCVVASVENPSGVELVDGLVYNAETDFLVHKV